MSTYQGSQYDMDEYERFLDEENERLDQEYDSQES